MYLNMSHWDAYRLPVKYRSWYLKRLEKYFSDKSGDKQKKPEPDGGQKSLKKYESMLQSKFENN